MLKLIPILCIVIGVLLFVFNILNISYTPKHTINNKYTTTIEGGYYYQDRHIIGTTIGVGLIVLGFLTKQGKK